MSANPSEYAYNFAAGPAVLPHAVHKQFVNDLNSKRDIPLLELGHRTPEFDRIANASENNLRELLHVPDDYAVLFMPGGARSQYFAIPMNLNAEQKHADYFNTGYWSECAMKEAAQYTPISVVTCVSEEAPYSLPPSSDWKIDGDAAYCHYVANETLTGFEFTPTDIAEGTFVSDMTSSLLTQPVDMTRHGLIYAAAQKNIGIAGITVVIVAREWLGKAAPKTPSVYNYALQDKAGSRFGTPAIASWYVCHLMLEWIKQEGGVEEMYRRSMQRSKPIYEYIDQSDIYEGLVAPEFRSRVNISFRIKPQSLEGRFLEKAQQKGLFGLRGHSAVGGIRASLYNGMPLKGADALRAFMQEFEEAA